MASLRFGLNAPTFMTVLLVIFGSIIPFVMLLKFSRFIAGAVLILPAFLGFMYVRLCNECDAARSESYLINMVLDAIDNEDPIIIVEALKKLEVPTEENINVSSKYIRLEKLKEAKERLYRVYGDY